MRIALVLRGHYRSFDTTSNSWLNALKGLNYDCYFHTWDLQDSTTPTWHRGEKYALPLYSSSIETLKKFDKDIVIDKQIFTDEDIQNKFIDSPYKAFIYRYESLRNTLKRIPPNTYDIIIVGRYDLLLNPMCLINLNISENEIIIGGIEDTRYYKNLRGTDLLFAFNPNVLHKFNINPYCIDREFNNGEEPFTDFIFKNFNKVSVKWKYENDFIIQR